MGFVEVVAKQMKKRGISLSTLIKWVGGMMGVGVAGTATLIYTRFGAAPTAGFVGGLSAVLWTLLFREPKLPLMKMVDAPRATFLRFVCVSDTHNRHEELKIPYGDILIHTGDFTCAGTLAEARAFNEWLGRQPHRYKFVVPGNHELMFDHDWYDENWPQWHKQQEETVSVRDVLTNASLVLLHESIEVCGVKIFGSPFMPLIKDHEMAFMRSDEEMERLWSTDGGAPFEPVDVLLTHSPPAGILDRIFVGKRIGCKAIRAAAERLQPKYHVFGHVHEQYGAAKVGATTFLNAASVCVIGHRAVPTRPMVFDLPKATPYWPDAKDLQPAWEEEKE